MKEVEDDKDDRKTNKRIKHEILSRMNQARSAFCSWLAYMLHDVPRRSQGGRYLEAGVAESASPI